MVPHSFKVINFVLFKVIALCYFVVLQFRFTIIFYLLSSFFCVLLCYILLFFYYNCTVSLELLYCEFILVFGVVHKVFM